MESPRTQPDAFVSLPPPSSLLRREHSYEEANVWAPRPSPTGRIFVGARGDYFRSGHAESGTPQSDERDGSGGRGLGGGDRRRGSARHAEGRGEVVFALARGVATVVTLSALTLVMVLLIIAEAVLMVVAEKIGLAPVVLLVLTCMFCVGRQMGVPFQSLARVLVFLWAF